MCLLTENSLTLELFTESASTSGFRVELDPASDPLGKRVRRGKVEKTPYVLVVGDDDVANDTVGVNARGVKDVERDVTVAAFIDRLTAEVDTKS